MFIEDLILYTNFPNKPIIKFSNLETNEVSFTFESEDIIFDGEYFSCINPNKKVIVTAKSKNETTTFNIFTKDYVTTCRDDMNALFYLNRVKEKEEKWKSLGSPMNGTVFMGDSFFDVEFWSDFYTTYKGYNVLANGVSSSTTTDWDNWVARLLYKMQPKNIVIHCGTNNLYDDKESSDVAINNSIRLLDTIRHHLPKAKIYYFAIEPRTYGLGLTNFDEHTYNEIEKVNNAVRLYCEKNDNIKFLDVTSNCYNGHLIVNASFFRDGVHPALDNYMVYVSALKDAGLKIE